MPKAFEPSPDFFTLTSQSTGESPLLDSQYPAGGRPPAAPPSWNSIPNVSVDRDTAFPQTFTNFAITYLNDEFDQVTTITLTGNDLSEVSYDYATDTLTIASDPGAEFSDSMQLRATTSAGGYDSPAFLVRDAALASGYVFRPMKLGAGGWTCGISIANDGNKVCHVDVGGMYRRFAGDNAWIELRRYESFPDIYRGPEDGVAAYALQVAPSDSSVIYTTTSGTDVMKSTDGGSTFYVTPGWNGVPGAQSPSNGSNRMEGGKMAIDPQNPDQVLVGLINGGVLHTKDGGDTWTQVLSGGTGQGVIFDPNSPIANGLHQGMYAAIEGQGIYRSADGGATWNLLSGTPTGRICDLSSIDSSGNLYFTEVGTWIGYKYDGSTFQQLVDNQIMTISHDPNNESRLVAMERSGRIMSSLDGGQSWTNRYNTDLNRVAPNIPWHAWTHENYMSASNFRWDPVIPNRIWFPQGIGLWYADLGTGNIGSQIDYIEDAVGIESMVAHWVWGPPGRSRMHIAVSDRAAFTSEDPDVFPAIHMGSDGKALQDCQACTTAIDDPDFVAFAISKNGGESGYSPDGGKTYVYWPTQPPDQFTGGAAICSTAQNVLHVNRFYRGAYYTKDGGNTWNPVNLPGTTNEDYYTDFPSGPFARCPAARDPLIPGKFWLYKHQVGLYTSDDGGDTWTQVRSGKWHGAAEDGFHGKLKVTPDRSGHLWWACGDVRSAPAPNPVETNVFLHRSTDGGVTWTTVPNVNSPISVGFGTTEPGATYPRVFLVGWVNLEFGFWYSDDECASWTLMAQWPDGKFGYCRDIDGYKDGTQRVATAWPDVTCIVGEVV